jgi:hypothetical protein
MSKVTSYRIGGKRVATMGCPDESARLVCHRVGAIHHTSKIVPTPHSQVMFAISVCIVNFALPVGFCVLNQYWLAVCAGLGAVAIAFYVFGRTGNTLAARELRALPPSGRAGALSSQRE